MIKDILDWSQPEVRMCLISIYKLKYRDCPPYSALRDVLQDCFLNEINQQVEKNGYIEGIEDSINSMSDYKFEWSRDMIDPNLQLSSKNAKENERARN